MDNKEFEELCKNRPHVVILGAGASKATIPNGDKNNKPISCMDGFLKNLGLNHLLNNLNLETKSDNLEDIYSEIYEKSKKDDKFKCVKESIETDIFNYFNDFEIPDTPTIYDYLLLSLRNKDLVASFNWDPLIIQAGNRLIQRRVIRSDELPKIIFLHGNVCATINKNTNRYVLLNKFLPLPDLEKPKLLYPTKHKNYSSDLLISESWRMLRSYLKRAYILTFFGYSAPKSDHDAIEVIKNAWNSFGAEKGIEEIEIIDIANRNDIYKNWEEFISSQHFHIVDNLFDSFLGKYPRRTTNQLFDVTMYALWGTSDRGYKQNMSFEDLKKFIKPLIKDEEEKDGMFNPYLAS